MHDFHSILWSLTETKPVNCTMPEEDFQDTLRKKMENLRDSLPPSEISNVPLTKDFFAIVDKEMEHSVNRFRWYSNVHHSYVHARRTISNKPQKVQSLQRFVYEQKQFWTGEYKQRKQITFENKITLDCRFVNIDKGFGRQAAMRNRTGKRNTTSIYKGVHQKTADKEKGLWTAGIADLLSGLGSINLGTYSSEVEAAQIYDAAATVLFKKSALLNFPDECIEAEVLDLATARIERFKNKKNNARNK